MNLINNPIDIRFVMENNEPTKQLIDNPVVPLNNEIVPCISRNSASRSCRD